MLNGLPTAYTKNTLIRISVATGSTCPIFIVGLIFIVQPPQWHWSALHITEVLHRVLTWLDIGD
jgi:hypothetical protein